MLNKLRIERARGGLRLVTCVVDGKKVEPFYVYPIALEQYPKEPDFLKYLERQARGLLSQFGEWRGNKVA